MRFREKLERCNGRLHISTTVLSFSIDAQSDTATRHCPPFASGGKEPGRTPEQTRSQIDFYNEVFTHAHMPDMDCVVSLASARAERG